MAAIPSQIYFRFGYDCLLFLGGAKPFVHQISTRYLSPRLIYSYFRFLKANGRRTEILLPVWILCVIGMSF